MYESADFSSNTGDIHKSRTNLYIVQELLQSSLRFLLVKMINISDSMLKCNTGTLDSYVVLNFNSVKL